MVLGHTAHFRLLSHRNYYAKWCSDRPIAQRLLAQRLHDSGQFRRLLDEEMLGTGLYQRTNRPTAAAKFPSLVNRLALRMLGNSPSVEIQASRLRQPIGRHGASTALGSINQLMRSHHMPR